MDYAERLQKSLTPLPDAFREAGLDLLSPDQCRQSNDSDYFDMVFQNNSSGVSLKLSISLNQGSISTFLFGSGQPFDIKEYFAHKARKDEYVAKFFAKDPEVYVENLCLLIKNEWHDLISGQRIEHVPRDWLGYK